MLQRLLLELGVGFIGSDEVQLSGDCVQRRRQGSILVRLSLEQHVSLLRVRSLLWLVLFFPFRGAKETLLSRGFHVVEHR